MFVIVLLLVATAYLAAVYVLLTLAQRTAKAAATPSSRPMR